jgi:hypothetical protein
MYDCKCLLPLLFACLQNEVNDFKWYGPQVLDPDFLDTFKLSFKAHRRFILLGEFGHGESLPGALAFDLVCATRGMFNFPTTAERTQVGVRASHR